MTIKNESVVFLILFSVRGSLGTDHCFLTGEGVTFSIKKIVRKL